MAEIVTMASLALDVVKVWKLHIVCMECFACSDSQAASLQNSKQTDKNQRKCELYHEKFELVQNYGKHIGHPTWWRDLQCNFM